jgi:hypothetical protein
MLRQELAAIRALAGFDGFEVFFERGDDAWILGAILAVRFLRNVFLRK